MAKIERDEIVKRATGLFRIGGYDDTSMAQIADACGIRKASLYHHFPEKDGLVLAAIERIHDHFREHIFAIAYSNDTDAKQRLYALCEATFGYFNGREGGCLLGNFTLALTERAPRFQEPLRSYFDDWAKAIAHLLTPEHGAGKARDLAFDSVAHVQGAIMMMRLYNDPNIFAGRLIRASRCFHKFTLKTYRVVGSIWSEHAERATFPRTMDSRHRLHHSDGSVWPQS